MDDIPTNTPPLPLLDPSTALDHQSPTTPSEPQILIVPLSAYKPAASCLASAFATDHVVRYPIDTPNRLHWPEPARYALHLRALEYMTYAHCVRGLVTAISCSSPSPSSSSSNSDSDSGFAAVALWMPPGKTMDDWFTMLRSGMWRLNYQLSAEGRRRFFDEFLPLLARTKAEVMGERDAECWYLVYLGTRPGWRRKGLARRLASQVLQWADQEGRACYLESSDDVNVAIYEKMGFRVVREIYLKPAGGAAGARAGAGAGEKGEGLGEKDKGIKMDIMVREPQKPQQQGQGQKQGGHAHL